MGKTLNPYDDIETFLSTIRSVMRSQQIFAWRVLTEDDFVQAGYLGLLQHWARFGKDENPQPSYRLIIFREMIEALRELGISGSRRLVNEPLVMDDAYAFKVANTVPDVSVSRELEARQFDTVVRLFDQLPPQEKMVMQAMLLHGVTQRQMMGRLHVGEARVSQIRANAVKHLRVLIAKGGRHER